MLNVTLVFIIWSTVENLLRWISELEKKLIAQLRAFAFILHNMVHSQHKGEGGKIGRVEGWKGGRVEGWKEGRMEGWKGGRMEEGEGGRMEEGKGGRMEEGEGGRVILDHRTRLLCIPCPMVI